MSCEAPKYFPALDGVRGVAALFVVWLHLVGPNGVLSVSKGYLAVDLFFVLSGAVVASAYEQRLLAGMPVRELFIVRVLRLYPLYLLGSVMGAMAIASTGSDVLTLSKVFLAIFMLPEWGTIYQASFSLDEPVWSLFFEFWVNMFYGYFLARLSDRILTALMMVSLTGISVMVAFSQAHDVAVGWTFATLPHGVFRIVYPFFVGVLLSRRRNSRPPVQFLRKRSNVCTILILFATAGLLATRPPASLSGPYDLVCVIALFPLLVYVSMQLTPSGRLFRVCATLGIISYPIYCIHWPLIMFLRVPLERAYANAFVAASSFLIAVAVLSYVVNYVYDAPVRRRLQRTFLANSVTGRARSPWIATTDSSIVPRQVGRQAASGETGSLDYAAPD